MPGPHEKRKKKKKSKDKSKAHKKSGHKSKGHKKSHSKSKPKKEHHKHHEKKEKKERKPPLDENLNGIVLVRDAKKHVSKAQGDVAVPPKQVRPISLSKEEIMGGSQEKAYRSREPTQSKEAILAQDLPDNKIRVVRPPANQEKKPVAPLPTFPPAPSSKGESMDSSIPRINNASQETPNIVAPILVPKRPLALSQEKIKMNSLEVIPAMAPGPVVAPAKTMPEPNSFAVSKSAETTDDLTRKEGESEAEQGDRVDQMKKWKSFVERLIEGGDSAIKTEFRNIRGYLPSAATRTDFDRNMEKNRFEDIVCIDHTRVRLLDGAYINANWVKISNDKKAILTQLPLEETASDFWQMILEQNVQGILLICTPYEFQTFSAEATFPKQQDFLHFNNRHIRVGEFKRVKIGRQWNLHVYSVTDGQKKRFVHMHHYNAWGHGQGPKSTTDLWQIQSVFRKYSGPHCYMSLSGCGRAGTYAAFEAAHERLHNENSSRVNVGNCVCRVRNGRMHAVQRASQLKFVHISLAEHVLNNGFINQLSPKHREKWTEMSKLV